MNGNCYGYGFFNWIIFGSYMGFWSVDELYGYGCYIGKEKNLIGEYCNGMMNGVGYIYEFENDKWEYGIFKNYLVDMVYIFYDNKVDIGCVVGDC